MIDIHVLSVFVGAIVIMIASEIFIAIRESKKRKGEKNDR